MIELSAEPLLGTFSLSPELPGNPSIDTSTPPVSGFSSILAALASAPENMPAKENVNDTEDRDAKITGALGEILTSATPAGVFTSSVPEEEFHNRSIASPLLSTQQPADPAAALAALGSTFDPAAVHKTSLRKPGGEQKPGIWQDVKRFELSIHHERLESAKPRTIQPQQGQIEQALVTTDPIANVSQSHMQPQRMIVFERPDIDVSHEDHPKGSPSPQNAGSAAAAPVVPFNDASPQTIDAPDPVLAVHHLEIPVMPRLQMVRTLAMEVGEDDSQVIIRIEERGGGLKLHLDAATDPMRNDLESSVETLFNAFEREEVPVSSIEFSRKPITKVRRMKETQ